MKHALDFKKQDIAAGVGGGGGEPFRMASGVHAVQKFDIWSNEQGLKALRATFTDGTECTTGHPSPGNPVSFEFKEGELIESLALWGNGEGWEDGRTGRLEFRTNYQRTYAVGQARGKRYDFTHELNSGALMGFHGRSGSDLDWVGLTVLQDVYRDVASAVGGEGGKPFTLYNNGAVVIEMTVWWKEYGLKAIKLKFIDQTEQLVGHPGGKVAKFEFQPRETIRKLTLWGNGDGWEDGRTGKIQFETNAGRTFAAGDAGGDAFNFDSDLESGIFVGLHGRAGADIDWVGLRVIRNSTIYTAEAHNIQHVASGKVLFASSNLRDIASGVGGGGGTPFSLYADGEEVRHIEVAWVSYGLKAIEVTFASGSVQRTGNAYGQIESFEFEPGERLIKLSLWGNGRGWENGRTGRMEFHTNRGRKFSAGQGSGRRYDFHNDLGTGMVAGFHGRSGSDLNWIGLKIEDRNVRVADRSSHGSRPQARWRLMPVDEYSFHYHLLAGGAALNSDASGAIVGLTRPNRDDLGSHWIPEIVEPASSSSRYILRHRLSGKVLSVTSDEVVICKAFDADAQQWILDP